MLCDLEAVAQKPAVLLMDNCSAQVSDDVIRIPTEASLRVISCAPHTTQIFQVRFIMKAYHDFGPSMI
jgi:hypothetical protein